jgi:hypothetical protein
MKSKNEKAQSKTPNQYRPPIGLAQSKTPNHHRPPIISPAQSKTPN